MTKHVACYKSKFIYDVDYKPSHFKIGSKGVWPATKFYFECLAMILVIRYVVMYDFVKWTIPLKGYVDNDLRGRRWLISFSSWYVCVCVCMHDGGYLVVTPV